MNSLRPYFTGGVCCDYRRAVIILSIFSIVGMSILSVLGMAGAGFSVQVARGKRQPLQFDDYYSGVGHDDDWYRPFDDDHDHRVDDYVADVYSSSAVGSGIATAVFFVFMLFYVFQLVAALTYSKCMLYTTILINLIVFGAQIAGTIIAQWWIPFGALIGGIVAECLFFALNIYPLVGLVREIQKGIMSPETYPREAYSCCCNPKF